MEQVPDVVSLSRTIDGEQDLDDVFEGFPEDSPAEVMALAEADEESSDPAAREDFEAFVDDLSCPRSPDTADDSATDARPADLTAEELFGD